MKTLKNKILITLIGLLYTNISWGSEFVYGHWEFEQDHSSTCYQSDGTETLPECTVNQQLGFCVQYDGRDQLSFHCHEGKWRVMSMKKPPVHSTSGARRGLVSQGD